MPILLPHTLELVEDPYAVLREAERVLCAEGCLMICGFNPYSGWGARRLFAQLFPAPAVSAADAAAARRAAAARLGGAARFRGGRRVYGYLGAAADGGPAAKARRDQREPQYRRAPALTRRGVPPQGAQARADADPGAAEAAGTAAGAGAGAPSPRAKSAPDDARWRSTPTGPAAAIPGPGGWAALLIAGARAQGTVAARRPRPPTTAWSSWRPSSGLERAQAPLQGEALHRFEVRAAGLHRVAAAVEGARLAHRRPRTCQEPGSMGAARSRRRGAGYRMALGEGPFGP